MFTHKFFSLFYLRPNMVFFGHFVPSRSVNTYIHTNHWNHNSNQGQGNLARSAFSSLQSSLSPRHEISLRTKDRVYQALVWSILPRNVAKVSVRREDTGSLWQRQYPLTWDLFLPALPRSWRKRDRRPSERVIGTQGGEWAGSESLAQDCQAWSASACGRPVLKGIPFV